MSFSDHVGKVVAFDYQVYAGMPQVELEGQIVNYVEIDHFYEIHVVGVGIYRVYPDDVKGQVVQSRTIIPLS